MVDREGALAPPSQRRRRGLSGVLKVAPANTRRLYQDRLTWVNDSRAVVDSDRRERD